MWSRVKDNNRLGTQQNVHWNSIKSRLVRAARETSIFQNWSNFANSGHLYIAEILPIRLKTLSNQSILKKIFVKTYHTQEQHNIQRKIKWDLYTSFSLWSHFLITVYSPCMNKITLLQDRKSHTVHQETQHFDMLQQWTLWHLLLLQWSTIKHVFEKSRAFDWSIYVCGIFNYGICMYICEYLLGLSQCFHPGTHNSHLWRQF